MCVDNSDPDSCTGPADSVMSPYIPGAPREELPEGDVEALRALYATTDGSRCEGPFRQGERCSCNDDCIEGMVCSPDAADVDRCSPQCSSENADCPSGFVCLLGPPASENEPAQGICVRLAVDALHPVAATCEQDRQCVEGLCALAPAASRNVCRVSCDGDGDCGADRKCSGGHCLWAGAPTGLACEGSGPGDDVTPCACSEADDKPAFAGVLCLLALGALSRRRRRRR
jgi:hypothetical protein